MLLEISNTRYREMNIISPSSKYRIRGDTCMASTLKESKECLTHPILQSATTFRESSNDWTADECVLVFLGISAGISLSICGPEPQVSDTALATNITVLVEDSEVDGREFHTLHLPYGQVYGVTLGT